MDFSNITNNNLLQATYELRDYLDDGVEPPFEVFVLFLKELEYSTLLIPGVFDGDELSFSTLTSDEDADFIPLFTSEFEYYKVFDDDEGVYPIPMIMNDWLSFLDEGKLAGIVIDPASLNFPLISEVLTQFPLDAPTEFDDKIRGYGPEKLKKIADEADNSDLLKFIGDDGDLNELMPHLNSSTLFNLIVTREKPDEKDGIVECDELEVCSIDNENGVFALLFTDRENILKSGDFDSNLNYYYQITLLSRFFEFVLRSDMEGIIINPATDSYLIPREAMLVQREFLFDHPSLKRALDYGFTLED